MLKKQHIDHFEIITIERHILNEQRHHPSATGILTAILYDLALAGKVISNQTNRAGLAEILGRTDEINIQGEVVQKLDLLADRTIYRLNEHTGRLAVMASEEHEDILPTATNSPTGKYVLLFDPLDGSSNIDYNISVGTIFSIYQRRSLSGPGTLNDCLQPAKNIVAAGYILFGSSTMFVYSTGTGVHGFTLDPGVGEFLLSHPSIKLPEEPLYFSANLGYLKKWSPGVQKYTSSLQGIGNSESSLSLRYVGSLVADFHRTLLSGGVFYYPADLKKPNGKLRLLYEAGPLGFLATQAGGYASDGKQDILNIQPKSLHQRTPFYVGNSSLVKRAEGYLYGEE